MFICVAFVTTFLAFMGASYAAPADRPFSPFDSLLLVFRDRTPTFDTNLRRQNSDNSTISLSDFPVQCQEGCAPSVNAINTCSSASCICNPTVDSSLAFCVSCSVNADPTPSIIQTGQQLVDTYNTLCKGTSVSTISFTITNMASDTNTASGTASSTSTASGTTSTNVTASIPVSTTTENVTPTLSSGPKTTISTLPQTGTYITPSILATASSTSNNAPAIRPRTVLTSIGLAIVLSVIL